MLPCLADYTTLFSSLCYPVQQAMLPVQHAMLLCSACYVTCSAGYVICSAGYATISAGYATCSAGYATFSAGYANKVENKAKLSPAELQLWLSFAKSLSLGRHYILQICPDYTDPTVASLRN